MIGISRCLAKTAFSGILFVFFLCFLPTHSLGNPPISADQIDQYLLEKNSPLAGLGSVFIEEGRKFNIDPRLVVAISGAETTFGTNMGCNAPFNAWSWFWNDANDCSNNPLDSWEDGIHYVTRQMAIYRSTFIQEDKEFTIHNIGHNNYCAEGCEHWEPNVTKYYGDRNELGGDISDLEFAELPLEPIGSIEVNRIDGAGNEFTNEIPLFSTVFIIRVDNFQIGSGGDHALFKDLMVDQNPYTISVINSPEYLEEVAMCDGVGCEPSPDDFAFANCGIGRCSINVNVSPGMLTRVFFRHDICAPGFEKSGVECVAMPGLIKVDGDSSDWVGINPILTDPAGDGPFDTFGQYYPGLDIINISVINDEARVYFLVEFVDVADPLLGNLIINLDSDRNSHTGCTSTAGSEYDIAFFPDIVSSHIEGSNTCDFINSDDSNYNIVFVTQGSFLEAEVRLETLRVLSPDMDGFRIWARALPPRGGNIDFVLPPVDYLLK